MRGVVRRPGAPSMTRLLRGVAPLGLTLLLPGALSAQFTGGAELRGEMVTFNDPDSVGIEWIALLMTPWDASLAVNDRVAVSAAGAWAVGRIEGAGSASEEIAGLVDTRLAVDVFLGRRALLSVSGSLPTGATELEPNELILSGVLAAQSLPFSMASWGSGGRVGADLAVDVSPSPATRVTLSSGFHLARSYEPLDAATLEYRPGNEFILRGSLEQYVKGVTLGLQLGLQRYGDDQVQGQNLFQAGTRTQAVVSALIPVRTTGSAALWASVTSRGGGTARAGAIPILDGAVDSPAQDLVQAGASLRLSLAGIVLQPELDTRLFRTEDGAGEGMLTGLGVTAEFPLSRDRTGRRSVLVSSLRGRTGHVETPLGDEVGIRSWEASLGVRWEVRR